MAFENRTLSGIRGSDPGSELEEEDLEKLQSDVEQMARKIAEYRATLPDQLKDTLGSILSSQRPILPGIELGSEVGPSGKRDAVTELSLKRKRERPRKYGHDSAMSLALSSSTRPGTITLTQKPGRGRPPGSGRKQQLASDGSQEQTESTRGASEVNDEVQTSEKMKLLKEKISCNVSTIPIVVKRMKECIARIDKLESSNETIHPAFRKRTN